MQWKLGVSVCAATLSAAFLCAGPVAVHAETAAPYFKGKVITIYVGFNGGGSYDYFGRLAARYLGQFIPGHPSIVVQNMPGAGSFRAAKFLYAAALKDGTAMAILTQTLPLEEALGTAGAQYKSAEFNGSAASPRSFKFFHGQGFKGKTFADTRKVETTMAGTGSGSPSEGYPKLLNALAGSKFRIISGYSSSSEGVLAAERGETDGGLTSWNTLERTKKDLIAKGEVNLLVQFGLERNSQLPDVPTALEVTRDDAARKVMAFYVSGEELGRSLVAAPGIPPERVAMLRKAFDTMVKDPEVIAGVEKTGQEFHPASGEFIQNVVEQVAKAPPAVVDKAKTLLKGK